MLTGINRQHLIPLLCAGVVSLPLVGSGIANAQSTHTARVNIANTVMNVFDFNDNGRLDFVEARRLQSRLTLLRFDSVSVEKISRVPAELRRIYQSADTDRIAGLSPAEISSARGAILQLVSQGASTGSNHTSSRRSSSSRGRASQSLSLSFRSSQSLGQTGSVSGSAGRATSTSRYNPANSRSASHRGRDNSGYPYWSTPQYERYMMGPYEDYPSVRPAARRLARRTSDESRHSEGSSGDDGVSHDLGDDDRNNSDEANHRHDSDHHDRDGSDRDRRHPAGSRQPRDHDDGDRGDHDDDD